jgi:hypothetical protein
MVKGVCFVLAFAVSAGAQPVRNDYGDPKTWLCRPGRQDLCAVDGTATIVRADGTVSREEWKPARDPSIDCFYVYPTVSVDESANSDMVAGLEERFVAQVQLARFGSQCRLYAPIYRQATLTVLRSAGGAHPLTADRELAYTDVLDAWRYYLQHDNGGRGVVLIGHSQGSGLLTRLIAGEIEGKPVQAKIVSAIIPGPPLAVPTGKDVGGAFQRLPLCRQATQTGCIIAYSSFRSTGPPPQNSRFGHIASPGMQAACVNPAALGGGRAPLRAYFPNGDSSLFSASVPSWPWVKGKTIDTPWVTVPGLLTAQCVVNERGSYLEVTVHGDPADPRADDICGDVMSDGQVNASWGLHLVDLNLALGDLVDVVRQQAKAFVKRKVP